MGEGSCNQEKQGKRSSISEGVSVHYLSLQRPFLHPPLFSLSHFHSVVIDSDPCTCVSCWRRLQLLREVAVQLTSSKYHIYFWWKIEYLPAEVCYVTTFSWLVLEHHVLICGTPSTADLVIGAFLLAVWKRQGVTVAQINVIQLFWREFTAPSYHKFCSLFAIAAQECKKKKKIELDLSHSDKQLIKWWSTIHRK